MTAYKTKLGQPNLRGNYTRDLGKKANGRQPRFTVGKDPTEASRRIAQLEALWQQVHSFKGQWDADTLLIGHAIARGDSKCVIPRRESDDIDNMISVAKLLAERNYHLVPDSSDWNEIYAITFDVLVERFGKFITLIPGDHAAYVAGHESFAGKTNSAAKFIQRVHSLSNETSVLEMETTIATTKVANKFPQFFHVHDPQLFQVMLN